MEIVADRHDADIEARNIHRGKAVFVHAVRNKRVGVFRRDRVDHVLVFIDDHHLVAHAYKPFAQRSAEFSHADQ